MGAGWRRDDAEILLGTAQLSSKDGLVGTRQPGAWASTPWGAAKLLLQLHPGEARAHGRASFKYL